MTREATDGTCWQCGAPADPGCVYTQNLVARAKYSDGLGNSVKRSVRGKDVVKVSVPRCEACQIRNYLSGFLLFIGWLIGACVGGLQFPSRGITTIVGAAVGCIPAVLLLLYYRRISGLRSIEDYPPLKRLREAGWEDPV